MKTKELIAQLKRLDPDGESEVTVEGDAILFADLIPGYYDGPYDVLLKDKQGYVTGLKVTAKGMELRIRTQTWEDVLWDNPDAILVVDDSVVHGKEEYAKRMEAKREEIRAELKKIHEEIDLKTRHSKPEKS